MEDLRLIKCTPCEEVFPVLILRRYISIQKVDGWDVKSDDQKIYYLIKEFKFDDFLKHSIYK